MGDSCSTCSRCCSQYTKNASASGRDLTWRTQPVRGRTVGKLAFHKEQSGAVAQGRLGSVGVGAQRFDEVAAVVALAVDLQDRTIGEQMIIDGVSIGDQIAFVIGKEPVHRGFVMTGRVAVWNMPLWSDQRNPEMTLAAALLIQNEDAGCGCFVAGGGLNAATSDVTLSMKFGAQREVAFQAIIQAAVRDEIWATVPVQYPTDIKEKSQAASKGDLMQTACHL